MKSISNARFGTAALFAALVSSLALSCGVRAPPKPPIAESEAGDSSGASEMNAAASAANGLAVQKSGDGASEALQEVNSSDISEGGKEGVEACEACELKENALVN